MTMVMDFLWLFLLLGISVDSTVAFVISSSRSNNCHSIVQNGHIHKSVAEVTKNQSKVLGNDWQHGNATSNVYTSLFCRVSYDGSRFTGWSAANDGSHNIDNENGSAMMVNDGKMKTLRVSRRQRRRGILPDIPQEGQGFVRPVEGLLKRQFAKLYGNVDPKRVIVEGCSRTDKGVHAHAMMAQVYCLTEEAFQAIYDSDNHPETEIYYSIPGKRIPHPESATDKTYFEPIPMDGNMTRIVVALNRMLTADVRVTGIAPVPTLRERRGLPFHPSLSAVTKTYEYKLSIGALHDPLRWRFVWNLEHVHALDIQAMNEACNILVGTHDFSAFQGAARGPEDRRKRIEQKGSEGATTCTLSQITIREEQPEFEDMFHGVYPPIQVFSISVTGDRFLYKMVRFLVGAIVAIGTGKLDHSDLKHALSTGSWETKDNQRKEFQCAPAHGLTLSKVDYGSSHIDWRPLRY